MYKKLALVCAKEATVSIQRDERNVFFAYVTPDPFRFTCVTQGRKLKQKHKRSKNCFITPREYLLLRRVVACPNRNDATKHTRWVTVACVVCVKGSTHSDLTVLILVCDTV